MRTTVTFAMNWIAGGKAEQRCAAATSRSRRYQPTGFRANLQDVRDGWPQFYGVRRA